MIYRGSVEGLRANLATLIDYDRKFKWLECGMCHDMIPHERYVIGDQACISCANKKDLMEEKIALDSFLDH